MPLRARWHLLSSRFACYVGVGTQERQLLPNVLSAKSGFSVITGTLERTVDEDDVLSAPRVTSDLTIYSSEHLFTISGMLFDRVPCPCGYPIGSR